jgi:uncharacterized membrane protein required for colicin V production
MVSLSFVFWMYVVLFAIIGGMRGWAKELLVVFSVILALTLTTLLEHYVPFVRDVLKVNSPELYFWMRSIVIGLLVFFGYQSPNIARFAPKMSREKIQDVLLGVVLGAVNGYLIAGTIWFYMHDAGYPFHLVTAPDPNTPLGKAALAMLQYMPPRILGIPAIYFAVVLAFIFVLVVFI